MKGRKWNLCNDNVEELQGYKNSGVVENYIGSFSSNVEKNIDKACKKQACYFQRSAIVVNPLAYIKFRGQACLPSLLYGTELFTLTPTLLDKFEQFLKHVFYVPILQSDY